MTEIDSKSNRAKMPRVRGLLERFFSPPQANQPNSENFEATPAGAVVDTEDHWSSPNGCHPDCPACEFELMGERPPLTADDLQLNIKETP